MPSPRRPAVASRFASRLGPFAGPVLGAIAACGSPACDPAPPPAPAAPASANAVPPYVPPPPDGCARTGSLEGVDGDPTCVVAHVEDGVMRDAIKHLTFDLVPDLPTVTAGGTSLLRLSITNGGASEVSVLFDATPPNTGPRPDWTRLAGVPEPRAVASGLIAPPEVFHLALPVRTLDLHDHPVDGLPTTSGGATPATRQLRVRLRPGGKLTHIVPWWALRIPAPAPITRDDAGHRFVPKTAPVALPPGEYVVNVELPLHGISAPESIVSTRLRVEKLEKPDASP